MCLPVPICGCDYRHDDDHAGLPKGTAEGIDVNDDGKIVGLF